MKTVELQSGKNAIVIITTTYLTKDKAISILTDIVYHKDLELSSLKKSEAIKLIRQHIKYQGVSVYSDWYEDTDATQIINELYKSVTQFIEALFPELR